MHREETIDRIHKDGRGILYKMPTGRGRVKHNYPDTEENYCLSDRVYYNGEVKYTD